MKKSDLVTRLTPGKPYFWVVVWAVAAGVVVAIVVSSHLIPGKDEQLVRAVSEQDYGRVRRLLSQGASPDAMASRPWFVFGEYKELDCPAVSIAALNGNEQILRALLDAGANVNRRDGNGHTPLWVAQHSPPPVGFRPAAKAKILGLIRQFGGVEN
jgi:hypothetical protein